MELSLINNINNKIEKEQKSFLNSTMGKVINVGVDIGLKALLPEFIEDEVISIKNIILENGFKTGLNTAISNAIDKGKSAIGILTGNFENINQVQTAINKGGILDNISDLIDLSIEKAKEYGIISNSICSTIKNGKNIIIGSIEKNINNELENQVKYIKKISDYSNKWNKCYTSKDFNGMENAYRNIKKYLKEVVPLESTLKEARTIENLHTLIKNKGGDFNITEYEMQLAQKL